MLLNFLNVYGFVANRYWLITSVGSFMRGVYEHGGSILAHIVPVVNGEILGDFAEVRDWQAAHEGGLTKATEFSTISPFWQSIWTVSPEWNLPSSRASERGSSTMCSITRLRGRAPNIGS